MVDCDFQDCDELIAYLPFKCKYCGGTFCKKHRLPENHDCGKRCLRHDRDDARKHGSDADLDAGLEGRSRAGSTGAMKGFNEAGAGKTADEGAEKGADGEEERDLLPVTPVKPMQDNEYSILLFSRGSLTLLNKSVTFPK